MPRFFISANETGNGLLTLTGENAQHIRVLRMKPGESVTVCDGAGTDYACTVREIRSDCVLLDVKDSAPSQTEPAVFCSVFMAFSKADKFEHVIQKATELGASEIVAFPSSRCVSRPDDKSLGKKLERWQKIASSAAEQSGRGRIPKVLVMDSYEAALQKAASFDVALFPYENEKSLSIRSVLSSASFSSVSIMTGPEGGFSEKEVTQALSCGMKVCTLGPRILRCETAPLCALSAVLYASGALD